MDVAFGRIAIHAQAIAARQTIFVCQHDRTVIDAVQRSGLNDPLQIIQGGVVGHGFVVDADPPPIAFTVAHFLFGLAMRPFLAPRKTIIRRVTSIGTGCRPLRDAL